ncbi:Superfamily II DNA and RNA helicase [Klenkia marina]|uniref:Superfamily II DNA and RNA helicase n=1 Tax=Klenkia marina TaxID=1960309 RepID=A0A1G4Z1T5_9ACTN|nr:DEAD/DEAH box helicase [Klenkia marina]SCX59606.1 Superfamily II DNA and RNA helicase [Klenkia marina]
MSTEQNPAARPRRRATSPAGPGGARQAPAFRAPGAGSPAQPLVTRHEPPRPETPGEPGTGRRRRRGGRGRGNGPRPEQATGQATGQQTAEQPSAEQQTAVRTPATPAPARPAAPAVVPAQAPATVLATDTTFAALGVPAPLVETLTASGITAPFPIQVATLPDTLAGKDVLGRGRTGSGKTLAFSLPLVARLAASTTKRQPRKPRSLILVPTRELANQVAAVVTPLATAVGMKTAVVFGGVGQNPQVQALAGGLDVLIACPGRLEDLIGQGHCDLSAVEITILDEADHMADLGFLPGVKRLMDRTPKVGQRLLFSATLDNGVDVLVQRYLDRPTTHSVDPAVAPVSTMTHHVFRVDAADKAQVVKELASGLDRAVLFTRTKHQAKKLAKQLTAAGVPAVDLHGNLSQNARERNLEAFTTGSTRVLCATDIAARGIHVDDVAIVVHVDPPAEHKAYLHRSGRTARAGAGGTVVTIATPDQAGEVRLLARQAGITPEVSAIKPGAREISALTGPAAPYVEPAPVVEQPQGTGGGRRRGAGGGGGGGRASGGASGAAGRSSSGGGRSSGPARTRAELAARAGQQPTRPRRAGR